MAGYEHGADVPEWWMVAFRAIIEAKDSGWTRQALAARASAIAQRQTPWETTRVTKFLLGQNQTVELTRALATAVGIPAPFFEARSMPEAEALHRAMRPFDTDGVNPETRSRVAAVAQAVDAIAKDAADQSRPVPSPDEGRAGSRRSGRTARRS